MHLCIYVSAKLYNVTIARACASGLVCDLMLSLNCILLHGCVVNTGPGLGEDGLGVCVFLEVPLAPMVSRSIPSSLTLPTLPPFYPSVSTPFSRLTQAPPPSCTCNSTLLRRWGSHFNPSQGLLYPCELKLELQRRLRSAWSILTFS